MTEENPVSWLAYFVFINLYVYLETIFTSEGYVVSTFRQTLHLTTLKFYY